LQGLVDTRGRLKKTIDRASRSVKMTTNTSIVNNSGAACASLWIWDEPVIGPRKKEYLLMQVKHE